MKIIIITLLTALCTSSIFAQEIAADKVPAPVANSFKAKFPAATKVSWEKVRGNAYEVIFTIEGVEHAAQFNAVGEWMETETEIEISDLPQAVIQAIRRQFPGFAIQEVAHLDTPDNGGIYEVGIRRYEEWYDVKLTPRGEVLSKEVPQD